MTYIYQLLAIIFTFSIVSCEKEFNNENDPESIPEENLVVNWTHVGGTGEANTDTSFSFNNAYWDDNGIYFSESSLADNYINFKVKDIEITETGNIALLQTPYATITADATYSTKVSPDFWTNGPNYNDLILGGTGYTPSAYYYNTSVTQGGYLKITNYNTRYISGEVYFTAWYYSNQLNREVSLGIFCEFSGVEYQ